jgi:SAM-dependent methyltransferase
MKVDPSNADALHSWDGDDGARWVEYDDIFDGCLARYDNALLDAVGPADRVLDVGCGTGSITRAAARRATSADGIDLSSQMLALAEHRAKVEGLDNVRFVLKHDSATVDRLDDLIAELQLDYFDSMRSDLSAIIGLQESAFLGDAAFGQLLDKILKREKVVEYYLSHTPPGLLMLRADGTKRMLLVQHDDALAVYKADEGAVDGEGMPPGLSARIAGGGWQPWFPTPHGLYTPDCLARWEDHLYPADQVGPWHCSVIDGDALSGVLERPVFSYNAYRRRPHQEAS